MILTREAVVNTIDGLIVVLVTRTARRLPTEATLGRRQGLPVPCVANFDNLLTIPRHRLVRLIGACDSEKIEELNRAARVALDL